MMVTLEDQSLCPKCVVGTSIGHAGRWHGEPIFICHRCHRVFHEDGREIVGEELERWRERVAASWEKARERQE